MIFGISDSEKDFYENNKPCPQAVQDPQTEDCPRLDEDGLPIWHPSWCIILNTMEEVTELASENGAVIVDGTCWLRIFHGYYD